MTSVSTPQSVCNFGLAHGDITPPVGIYHRMWGAATHDRATGLHRPLRGTAFVFQAALGPNGAEAEQVVLALDLCLLWAREMNTFLETVCQRAGLTREQVLVVFSHTHGAGLMGLERVDLPGGDLIAPYLEQLAAVAMDLVQQARRGLQAVTITYGSGHCSLAGQRDFWDADSDQFVCGFNPDGSADDTVLVAAVHDAAGRSVATMVNYACHPTTLAWQNTLISPDFPGAMRELIEAATGVPCVFLQGASGELGPREGFVGDVAVADRNGRQLGHAALSVLEALPPPGTRFDYTGPVVSGATLGTWAHVPVSASERQRHSRWRRRRWTVDLPYRPELKTPEETRAALVHWQAEEEAARGAGDRVRARDCRALAERMTRQLTRLADLPSGANFPLPVTLWQAGDVLWLAVEGEHYQLLQRALRRRFPATPIMVMTLANGSRCAYLPTADAYNKGIYQESIAVLSAGCLERLIDDITGQISTWATQP